MPSTSKKQHNFMAAVANNPAFAKKAGVPQSVGEDFTAADKGRKFAKGGDMKESKAMDFRHAAAMKKAGVPKKMVKEELAEAKGMKCGGKVKKYAAGGAMPVAPAGMPAQANYGGATRGLDQASAMSGRDMSGTGAPSTPGMQSLPSTGTPASPGITAAMKKGGAVKKFAAGGPTMTTTSRAMPASSNKGGAMRGLDRAAAMSGRTMPTAGKRPAVAVDEPTMKKGGAVKKFSAGGFTRTADGIASKGKTRGKFI